MAVYNRAALVRQALDSVLAQTSRDFELIVVDDGSTDETPEVLSSYAGRATLVRQPNGGPAAARNKGFGLARGRYVCIIDSDDLWFPWTLTTFEQTIRGARF